MKTINIDNLLCVKTDIMYTFLDDKIYAGRDRLVVLVV